MLVTINLMNLQVLPGLTQTETADFICKFTGADLQKPAARGLTTSPAPGRRRKDEIAKTDPGGRPGVLNPEP